MIGLLAPQALRYLGHARTDAARIGIQNLGAALDLYRLDLGRFPAQDEGLRALVERPAGLARWQGPYMKDAGALIDPWGRPYRYRIPGEHAAYDLYTLGADDSPGRRELVAAAPKVHRHSRETGNPLPRLQ
jgi:general secretion pathway protein G